MSGERWHTVELSEGVYLIECPRGILGTITHGVDCWHVSLAGGAVLSQARDYLTCLGFIDGFETALRTLGIAERWEDMAAQIDTSEMAETSEDWFKSAKLRLP